MSKSRQKRQRRSRPRPAEPAGRPEPTAEAEEEPVVEWSVLPASRHPGRLVVALLLIFAAGAGAVFWFESLAYAVASAAVMALAVLPFLLLTHYRLRAGEIQVRTALYSFRRTLSSFRSFELVGERAWLCTQRRRALIDNYRGMLLLLGDRAEDVRSALIAAGLVQRGAVSLAAGSAPEDPADG